jgi:2-polyprenyl-3-methyl-5-hydroxy-6-metoxy-1,4-benzoquinol methylase
MPDWNQYARNRNLSRNRLLLARHGEVVEEFLAFFGRVPNDAKVLDIGPANGLFMVLLRELGFEHVDGLEISPHFREVLSSKNLSAHAGDIVAGDGLAGLSPPYDVVVLMEVLEHLEQPAAALRHVLDLLAPGGQLYLMVPMRDCIFDRVRRVVGRKTRRQQVIEIDETHLHAFNPRDVRTLLEEAGFEVSSLRRVSMQPPRAPHYQPGHRGFLLLRSLLPRFLRGYFLCAVARPGKVAACR